MVELQCDWGMNLTLKFLQIGEFEPAIPCKLWLMIGAVWC